MHLTWTTQSLDWKLLRHLDSFDHYASGDLAAKYADISSPSVPTISANGRRSSSCMDIASSGSATRYVGLTVPSHATYYIGFALKYTSLFATSSNGEWLIQFRNNTNVHVAVVLDQFRRVTVYRGQPTTNLIGSSTFRLKPNVWHYFEAKATIGSGTSGAFEIRVNGVSIAANAATNTRSDISTTIDNIRFGSLTIGSVLLIDDVYILDGSGSVNNTFLGDVGVQALLANGNGNSSQWVGEDADSTDNYLQVDETAPDGDTTYVEGGSVSDKDTYTFGNLAGEADAVHGVQIVPMAKKTDGSTREINTVARLSSTEVDSSAIALGSDYAYLRDIREEKPGSGAWDVADVNNAEFGVKVAA